MILVSGGTGFVGSAVVAELLRRDQQVAVLGRDEARIRRRYGNRVEARAADVRQPSTLPAAMTGIDIVINAVQLPNSPIESKRRGWTFEQVDYEGTRHQVDAAKAAGVRRFLYVSGVGAAPDAARHWFRFKWQAEEHLRASGIEWVVVRPSWAFGPGDHALNRLLGFGRFLPFIPMFGDGQQALQPIFVDDLARIIADAALKPEAANRVFEAGGPETMTMDEVLKTGLDVMGKKRPILHQPVFVGKALGTLMSLLPSPPLPPPPLSADAVDFITWPAVADKTDLERVLQPRLTPVRQALETYLGRK
ncbi:MAG: NAD(P)H-binding protein [Dehalococcoidia bacterium]|nr:NAD(P)H-binding protein [Dehalococcoidia bacterium]